MSVIPARLVTTGLVSSGGVRHDCEDLWDARDWIKSRRTYTPSRKPRPAQKASTAGRSGLTANGAHSRENTSACKGQRAKGEADLPLYGAELGDGMYPLPAACTQSEVERERATEECLKIDKSERPK